MCTLALMSLIQLVHAVSHATLAQRTLTAIPCHPNPHVCNCGTVPGPLHAPQLGSGAHSAGSITSGKTHREVNHAIIMGTASMGDGALLHGN